MNISPDEHRRNPWTYQGFLFFTTSFFKQFPTHFLVCIVYGTENTASTVFVSARFINSATLRTNADVP